MERLRLLWTRRPLLVIGAGISLVLVVVQTLDGSLSIEDALRASSGIVTALAAQGFVTPVADPRTNEGTELVPKTTPLNLGDDFGTE